MGREESKRKDYSKLPPSLPVVDTERKLIKSVSADSDLGKLLTIELDHDGFDL